jgi:hypothetical protein
VKAGRLSCVFDTERILDWPLPDDRGSLQRTARVSKRILFEAVFMKRCIKLSAKKKIKRAS